MKILAFVLLTVSFCGAQTLPDAPQPQTTCVENNGKPCPEWLHKLIGQYPPLPEHYAYPSWHEAWVGHHALLFWTAEGLATGSLIADAEITHQGLAHHRCVEGNAMLPRHPSRGQLYVYNFEWAGPFLLASFLLRKTGMPIAPYASPLIIAGIHSQAAESWSNCF